MKIIIIDKPNNIIHNLLFVKFKLFLTQIFYQQIELYIFVILLIVYKHFIHEKFT